MWLVSLIVLTYVFTTAFTNKYQERIIDLKQELLDKDEQWQKEMFKQMSALNTQIMDLAEENEELRRRLQ